LALAANDIEGARAESLRFHNDGISERFNQLMRDTLMVQARKVSIANSEAISLAHYITGVLPLFMLGLAGFTALIAWGTRSTSWQKNWLITAQG